MTRDAKTVQEYLDGLPADRRPVIERLRREILDNLPAGFSLNAEKTAGSSRI